MNMNLNGLSADALDNLAKKAADLARDLRAKQPSIDLALEAGVRNRSYPTVANGWIADYSGEAVITMADGSRWQAIGHGPSGNAAWVSRQGWIEFIPLPLEPSESNQFDSVGVQGS